MLVFANDCCVRNIYMLCEMNRSLDHISGIIPLSFDDGILARLDFRTRFFLSP